MSAPGVQRLDANTGIAGWSALKVLWFASPDFDGPFIVRGQRVDGAADVRFGGSEPKIDALVVPPGPTVNDQGGYRIAPEGLWVTGPGCYGLQIDGPNFTDTIYLQMNAS